MTKEEGGYGKSFEARGDQDHRRSIREADPKNLHRSIGEHFVVMYFLDIFMSFLVARYALLCSWSPIVVYIVVQMNYVLCTCPKAIQANGEGLKFTSERISRTSSHTAAAM